MSALAVVLLTLMPMAAVIYFGFLGAIHRIEGQWEWNWPANLVRDAFSRQPSMKVVSIEVEPEVVILALREGGKEVDRVRATFTPDAPALAKALILDNYYRQGYSLVEPQ